MWRGHLRGHLLLFDRKPRTVDPGASIRLFLLFVFLEAVIGPRLWIASYLELSVPSWIRIPALLIIALVLIRFVARIRFADIGIYPWRDWSVTERSYFVQVVILGNLIFASIYASRLNRITTLAVATQLTWGFYQELVYRGILQTALVSRIGAPAGILIANTLYTFGPLHWYHFARVNPWPMFAGIFAIGLFFSLVFWRSGNLVMVGVFHGIGNAYMNGTKERSAA